MAFWKRKVEPVDRISSEALADYGRFEFLGSQQSGVAVMDSYNLISEFVTLSYPPGGPGVAEVIAELRRHASKGEWEKVGAWEYVRNFLTDVPEANDLVDEGLLALHRMRVTNLSIHMPPLYMQRYAELTGGPPPNDGFFGPPVFDSDYGPTRQYYFDHAVSTAAARQITRVPSTIGVEPGPCEQAVRAMWDFGLLVYRGPLVVAQDISFEPNVVKPAVEAASGVDHHRFAERLVDGALDRESTLYGPWTSIGAARFIEDYLDPAVADAEACARAIDNGLAQLLEMGVIGVGMSPELFTLRQRERLAALRS